MEQDLKTLQKKEAIERLKILQDKFELMETVTKEFKKDNTVYYSEYVNHNFQAVLYWISNEEKYVNIVKEVEEEKNILVYHAILTPTIYGTRLSLLYVSDTKDEWQSEKSELQEGFPLAYCINLADPEMAEFGGIQIGCSMGGIRQLA